MPESPLQIGLDDEAATMALGERLARALPPAPPGPFVVYLQGPLGAGKTTLVRGLLRQLGFKGAVRSPTYTLLENYEMGDLTCIHLDLYRLSAAEELEQLGLRDLLQPGHVWLVEWPQRGGSMLPPADLVVDLQIEGEGRRARLLATGDQAGEVMRGIS